MASDGEARLVGTYLTPLSTFFSIANLQLFHRVTKNRTQLPFWRALRPRLTVTREFFSDEYRQRAKAPPTLVSDMSKKMAWTKLVNAAVAVGLMFPGTVSDLLCRAILRFGVNSRCC
jgi:hypothetical protein